MDTTDMNEWWSSFKQQNEIPLPPKTGSMLWYAHIYATRGWRVLPCHTIINGMCSCKDPECSSPGKHPLKTLVPHGATEATADIETINTWWSAIPEANVAIATGPESGIFVIDVDINESLGKFGDIALDALTEAHGKLPDTVQQLTGGGGKHFFFKYPALPHGYAILNSTGKLGTNIDCRGDGGYVMAEPAQHISGHAYAFEADSDITQPTITLADAPKWIVTALATKKSEVKPPNSEGVYFWSSELDTLSDEQRAEFMRALYACPNLLRDDWLYRGMEIHATDPTETGFTIWEEWSKQGIGAYKYKAKDQVVVWMSFKTKRDEKRTKDSLFFEARKHGYRSVLEQNRTEQLSEQASTLINEINRKPEAVEDYVEQHPLPTQFPLPILNRMAGIINAMSDGYNTTATMQAVICLIATLTSRRYVTPQGDGTQLYVGVSSCETGNIRDLRYTQRGVRHILNAAKLRRIVRESRITGQQVLLKALYNSPVLLYLNDDYTSQIKLCNRQTTGGIEIVLNTITRIYDERLLQVDQPEDVGILKTEQAPDAHPQIIRPALNMLSLLHYGQLSTFTRGSELARGSVEQFLLAVCDDSFEEKESQEMEVADDIIKIIQKIRNLDESADDYSLDKINWGGLHPLLHTVEFCDSIERYDLCIDSISNDKRHRPFKAGAKKNLRRLITAMAAFDNPDHPIATRAVMEFATQWVVGNLARVLDRLEVMSSESGETDIYQKVLGVIFNRGSDGIRPSDLQFYCRPYKSLSKDKRDEVIGRLLEDKNIELKGVKTASGQTKQVYLHEKFIKKQ